MSPRKHWLAVLATMLVVGMGAGMPWAAALVQDLYGVSAQETLPFDPVSLTLQQDAEIGPVLRLMCNPYDEGDWPGDTRMTEDEACMAALDALAQLEQHGLLESDYAGYDEYVEPNVLDRLKASGGSKASPVMFISRDAATAVIWICHWKAATGPSYTLLVDDTTGKAAIGYVASSPPDGVAATRQRTERWRSFFQDYYGVEVKEAVDLGGDVLPRCFFRLDLGDGEEDLGMLVNIYYYEMVFNPCFAESVGAPLPSEDVSPVLPGPSAATDRN